MTNKIRQQILKVRDDGRTNMLDTNGVMYFANQLHLYELVVYLDDQDNRKEYWNFIMTGEAVITDETPDESVPEEEEDEDEDEDEEIYSPPTREEQVAEAVKRLRMLFADDAIPDAFEKTGTAFLCDHPDGHPIPMPMEMMDDIRQLEKQNDLLVYLVIADSWSFSYLYVSQYKEEWELDVNDLGEGYPVVYVENIEDPECSEFGSIHIVKNGDGFIRTA